MGRCTTAATGFCCACAAMGFMIPNPPAVPPLPLVATPTAAQQLPTASPRLASKRPRSSSLFASSEGTPRVRDPRAPGYVEGVLELEAKFLSELKQESDEKERERLSQLHENIKEVPMFRQCHQYRWAQSKEGFRVEFPMPRPYTEEQLYIVIGKETFQLAIRGDDTFRAVTGKFAGQVDMDRASYRMEEDGESGYMLVVRLPKKAHEGTYEFWHYLLEGEQESPTIRFCGETQSYTWKQDADFVDVKFRVPDDVYKRGTHLEIHPSGDSLSLRFDEFPEFGHFKAKFKGLVNVADCIWMLDEERRRKYLTLTLSKRRDTKDRTSWWSGVFEGDELWAPDQPKTQKNGHFFAQPPRS